MSELVVHRENFIHFLRSKLFGPSGGSGEYIRGSVFRRYLCGVLAPTDVGVDEIEVSDEPDTEGFFDDRGIEDASLVGAYERAPSSLGISFYLSGTSKLTCSVEAARYVQANKIAVGLQKLIMDTSSGKYSTPTEVNQVLTELIDKNNLEEEGTHEIGSGIIELSDQIAEGDKKNLDRIMADLSKQLEEVEGLGQEDEKNKNEDWHRIELAGPSTPEKVDFTIKQSSTKRWRDSHKIFEGRCELVAIFRPLNGGYLVTVTMVNNQDKLDGIENQIKLSLFQCRFTVEAHEAVIGEYPTNTRLAHHEEDQELSLSYRKRKTHGIGHGCAAIWDPEEALKGLKKITAEPLPVTEVYGLTNEIENLPEEARSVLSLQWLASENTSPEQLNTALNSFSDAYENWITAQVELAASLEAEYSKPAKRILDRQKTALERIRRGIDIIVNTQRPDVLVAFRKAQEAMLTQFLWSKASLVPCEKGNGNTAPIDVWAKQVTGTPKWRPFQLAFQLLVIESLVDPDVPEREIVDLLWFPTGGGKTEAYLALAAFEIIYRRIRFKDAGGGTTVLMRYTLRLLTSQQFERCATLISTLDWMRRSDKQVDLGKQPITLGLWVGGDASPNRLTSDSQTPGARELLEDRILEAEKPENPFQLIKCPRCGTRIIPSTKSNRADYGLEIDQYNFKMYCPDEQCDLHEFIPVSVVDDHLYKHPPTMLIGTIDKFAQMTWKADTGVFLGAGRAGRAMPPSLIIQDELHLITGPLGTIAGTYEAAIETVMTENNSNRPKYIAATATIQRANEQSQALYARDATVFPPTGLNSDDSFFSREDRTTPGRAFVGYMGTPMYSALTTLIQASAACAAAVSVIAESEKNAGQGSCARDAYWTQVIYHNSRQELGTTTTRLRDDVKVDLGVLQLNKADERDFNNIQELSANLKGPEVGEAKDKMQIEWPNPDAIDVLACTNMISVGVDIGRLGLMIMKSQPKSTSEYIQSTSRVGRDSSRPPGVVVTVYAANRPRDRSHYESFQSFHQSLYRAVEPVTVTPFAPPALQRTLHAAIVLTLRLIMGWDQDEEAQKFKGNDPHIEKILSRLKIRLLKACKDDEKMDVETGFESIVKDWDRLAGDPTANLIFGSQSAGGDQFTKLLGTFDSDSKAIWQTLSSMRHVDGETPFRVRSEGRRGVQDV
jgi:hypothetical protein